MEEAAEARDSRAVEAAALAARRALSQEEAAAGRLLKEGAEARTATAVQHGQSTPAASAPARLLCSSGLVSGRAWRLWAARHSQGETWPLGSVPATTSGARASLRGGKLHGV